MIRSPSSLFLLLAVIIATASAFAPQPSQLLQSRSRRSPYKTQIYQLGGEQERKKLTRDDEPEDYFRTNTDKMTDEEKFPIAIAGLVGISLPFIIGLIALYAAK